MGQIHMKKILVFLTVFSAGLIQAGQDINKKIEDKIVKCCVLLKMPSAHILSSPHDITDSEFRDIYQANSPKYCDRFLELRKTVEFKKLQNDLCLANEKASARQSDNKEN